MSKYECKVKELQKLAYENHLQSGNPKFKQLEKEIHEELYKELNKIFKGDIALKDNKIICILPNKIEYRFFTDYYPDECHLNIYYNPNNKNQLIMQCIYPSDEILELIEDFVFENIWVRKKGIFGLETPTMIEKEKFDKLSERKKRKYIII